jgi:DNA polymerase III subunit delta
MRFGHWQIKGLSSQILQGKLKAVLICGPDTGLIDSCISTIASVLSASVHTIAYDELLAIGPENALSNLNIFGSSEVVKIHLTGGKMDQVLFDSLISSSFANFPVFIASEVSKSSPLRKQFESSLKVGIVDCYELDDKSPAINSYLQGYVLTKDAKQYLLEQLPKDRNSISMELAKLKCFCGDKKEIGLDEVMQSVGHCSHASLDELFFALAERNGAKYFAILDDLLEAGTVPILLLRSVLRYYLNLDSVLSSSEEISAAVSKLSPPIFFKYVSAFCALISSSSHVLVKKALYVIYQAEVLLKQGEVAPQRVFEFIYFSIYELPCDREALTFL